jgi:hypothetical protein
MNFEVVLISYNMNKFATCNEQVWHFQPVSEEVHLYIDFCHFEKCSVSFLDLIITYSS